MRLRDRRRQRDKTITPDVWDAVQAQLDGQRVARRSPQSTTAPSPLAGMLFDHNGEPLTPGHASKGPARIRYRYYISNRLVTGLAADHPNAWRLPAEPVERAVGIALADLLGDDGISRIGPANRGSAAEHQRLLARIDGFATAAGEANGEALRDLLTQISARIEIGPQSITLSVSRIALARELDLSVDPEGSNQRLITVRPLLVRKRGVETRLVLGDVETTAPDTALIQLVADARCWMQRLRGGEFTSIRALARHLHLDHRQVSRALPLAFLAPDIVAAIVEGRQPVELTARKLERICDLPIRWDKQRAALAIPQAL
jgi:hypothetical protein